MENILSVDLSSETSPVVQEVRGREYIEYGTEHWKNLYPNFLIDLYYNSSTHAAIINTTAEMIAGEDIIVDENENLEQFVKLKKFFAEANGKETLHEVIKKISFLDHHTCHANYAAYAPNIKEKKVLKKAS